MKSYIGTVGVLLLGEMVGPRCLKVPPPEPRYGMKVWEMMDCPLRTTLDWAEGVGIVMGPLSPADFKPQVMIGPPGMGLGWRFGYVLPGIYGEAA